ncbi:MAG: hypothetical protein RL477_222, partial [Pseudomonadota bacterium]
MTVAETRPAADLHAAMLELGRAARAAARVLAQADGATKNKALASAAAAIRAARDVIIAANGRDLD